MSNKILNSLKCVLFKTPICLADIPLKTSYLQVFIYFDSIYIQEINIHDFDPLSNNVIEMKKFEYTGFFLCANPLFVHA